MSVMTDLLDRLKLRDLEHTLGLHPPYPPVAVQLDRETISLVRLKPRRGKPPLLEAVRVAPLPSDCVPASIFHNGTSSVDLTTPMRELFEASGTRPGRVSLVVPDNLAKVSLLSLPERPASSKQLDALVRSQMRRAVPFRAEEARISYQELPTAGGGLVLLVAVMRRALVEQYEQALEAVGSQVGLVDLCTTNLLNLCSAKIDGAVQAGGDVAVLNCERHYFTLAIVRGERLIFFRCKTYPRSDGEAPTARRLIREFANSLSYYREKLQGTGIGTLFVRSAAEPVEPLLEQLAALNLARMEPIDPVQALEPAGSVVLDAEQAQRVAPAIGAAGGRS